MKRLFLFVLIFLFINHFSGNAQLMLNAEHPTEQAILKTANGQIHGTLMVPKTTAKIPVVLIISGSGPTDRDGNNPRMKNNALKLTAELLADLKVASLRYDKRGIAESKTALKSENDIRFEHYINDASAWIDHLKADARFSKVIVFGHSEGSLIGMIAANNSNADAFISVAGIGTKADEIILNQLEQQSPDLKKMAVPVINSLKQGELVTDVPVLLASLFRPSVQPYMISWFKYDPITELKKLGVPVLILQGTTDIQVSTTDAELLHAASDHSILSILDGMNHILKNAPENRNLNIQTYNQPDLPLHSAYCQQIREFIRTF